MYFVEEIVKEALELTMVDWQQHPQFVKKDNACLSKVRDSQMLYQHVYKYLAGRVLRL